MRRRHAHRDVWVTVGAALLVFAGGTPTAVWGVQIAAPAGRVSLWPNPFIIGSIVVFVVAVYILLALFLGWPLPGGFAEPEAQGPPPPPGRPGERVWPMEPPLAYQIQQLEQVIRKVAETTDELSGEVIQSVLAKLPRTGTDEVYEPLHLYSLDHGLAALVEQGVLEAGPYLYRYRIVSVPERRGRFRRRQH